MRLMFFESVSKSILISYISILIVNVNGEIPTFHSPSSAIITNEVQSWTHEILLENGVEIYWNANDPKWLIMEISANTLGYVGIGFSPNGGMAGSDIFLGQFDGNNGSPQIHDYYAEENSAPKLDKSQDIEMLVAVQTENATRIRFRRKWDTGDEEHDIKLTGDDTFHLIWAWGQNSALDWHGANRGVRSVFLKTVQTARRFPDDVNTPGVDTLDFKVDNLHVPVQETTYNCHIVKIPAFEKKQHIIGYRSLIQKENVLYVHHITLYKCGALLTTEETLHGVLEQYFHQGGDCLSSENPLKFYCYEIFLASLVGSEGEMFPDHLGIPIMPGKDIYFRFEIHYDNAGLHTIIDSSGIRLFYTDEERDGDMGMLFLGNKVTPFQVIPQNLKKFTTYSFCPEDCTESAFPESGVKVIGVLLHAHKAGIAVRLRHVRNGKELTPIAVDNHYNFNYQQYRTLPNEVKILRGDALIVECDYNSLRKNDTIIGGFPSQREMCQAAVWIYPKVDALTDCRSQIEYHSFFDALDIDHVYSHPILKDFNVPYITANFDALEREYTFPDDSYVLEVDFAEYKLSSSNPWKQIMGTYKNQNSNEPSKNISVYNALLKKSSNANDAEILQHKWRNGYYYVNCQGSNGKRLKTGKDLNEAIIQKLPNFVPYGLAEKEAGSHGSLTVFSTVTILSCFIVLILAISEYNFI